MVYYYALNDDFPELLGAVRPQVAVTGHKHNSGILFLRR